MGDIDTRQRLEALLRKIHPDRADAIIAASKVTPSDHHCILADCPPSIASRAGKIVALFDVSTSRNCLRCGGTMHYQGIPCRAARVSRAVDLLNAAQIPARYIGDILDPKKDAKDVEWVKALGHDSKGLWLYGPSGTGKTRKAAMIARQIITLRRFTTRFVAFEDLVRRVNASYQDDNKETELKIYAEIASIKVLILDEIPLGFAKRGSSMTEQRSKVLSEVIDARYRRGDGILILTSNGDPAQVYAGIHRFDEWTASRIEDRLREMVSYRQMKGKSKRKGEKLTRKRPRTQVPTSEVKDPLARDGAAWVGSD